MGNIHPKRLLTFFLIASFAFLAGCGGGSGGSSSSGGAASSPAAATPGTTASAVQLLVSSPQMPSSGTSTTGLTAIVLNSTGQVVSGRTVVFSTGGDSTAYVSNVSNNGISDSNGLVTAQLNLGGSKTNRTISVSATVDGKTATNSVSVTGTTLSFSGNNSLSFGATTSLTIGVKDSAGNPVANMPVSVKSSAGNGISPSTGYTDSSGSIVVVVTAAVAGSDVITASAAGATQTQNLTVSNANFNFTVPSSASGTPQINVNTPAQLSVLWTNTGTPVAGSPVTFTASRGTIGGSPSNTNGSGTASATIQSASAGPSIITATGPGGTPSASINVNFVATSAANVTVQANPSTLQPTTGAAGQTSNVSTISAVVRDSANNLVENARVDFSIVSDTTGGTLSASTAVTNASGTASVNYIAGPVSGAQNGVTISATPVDINGVAISPAIAPGNVTLTVGGSALFVRLGTDNTVGSSPPNYTKTFSAMVTDSAGNPAPAGTQVRFVLRPVSYYKGSFAWGGTLWVPVYSAPQSCLNEDVNFNGILGPTSVSGANSYGFLGAGAIPISTLNITNPNTNTLITTNDFNGNGKLDPGNVASVNATATTDANGFAQATVSYAKSYAYWVTVTLEARAGVVGNDPPATTTYYLQGLSSDYNTQTIAPPGIAGSGQCPSNAITSPYGCATTCYNPN